MGCALQCSVLADTIQDCPFMVARNDVSSINISALSVNLFKGTTKFLITILQAIYCYTTDGRGPCYAVDGTKVCLQWFRTYLIIVAEDNKNSLQSPVTVSSTSRYLLKAF